jgi:hypothetical protein
MPVKGCLPAGEGKIRRKACLKLAKAIEKAPDGFSVGRLKCDMTAIASSGRMAVYRCFEAENYIGCSIVKRSTGKLY